MIFSIDNLKNLNENKDSVFNRDNDNIIVNEDSSFFIESLNMILEENRNFIANSILEAKKMTTLNVSNPSESLKVIANKLDTFILQVEKLLKKFESTMSKLGSRTTLMKSYSVKDFSSIKHTIKYKNTLSNYTNIGVYNSYTSYETQLNDIFSILLRNLEKFAKIKTSKDFGALYDQISKQKNPNIGDEYRSKILGKKYSINDDTDDNENFYDELKKYFTGDGDDSEIKGIEFTPERIKTKAKAFYSNSNMICVKKECREMIESSREFQKNINKLELDSYISLASNKQDWMNHSAKSAFDSIVNDALFKTQILCNVYLRYIAAKMEAAVKNRHQDIKVLKYILNHKDDEGGSKK